MDMLFLVGAMSVIIWYIIDRLKELWVNVPYSKYITVGISAILSFAFRFLPRPQRTVRNTSGSSFP